MKKEKSGESGPSDNLPASTFAPPLVEGEDYYLERGFMVFTESFLKKRGACCQSGCRHCPYQPEVTE